LEIYKEQNITKHYKTIEQTRIRWQWTKRFGTNETNEKQLLNKVLERNASKILNVKQELLKLNTAIQQQGEENKRQSETNKRSLIIDLMRCQLLY
jgi:hypothetical protein